MRHCSFKVCMLFPFVKNMISFFFYEKFSYPWYSILTRNDCYSILADYQNGFLRLKRAFIFTNQKSSFMHMFKFLFKEKNRKWKLNTIVLFEKPTLTHTHKHTWSPPPPQHGLGGHTAPNQLCGLWRSGSVKGIQCTIGSSLTGWLAELGQIRFPGFCCWHREQEEREREGEGCVVSSWGWFAAGFSWSDNCGSSRVHCGRHQLHSPWI